MADTPIARHFARLRLLLSLQVVAKLEDDYRDDVRQYERDSRQRTKARQAARRAARSIKDTAEDE